VAYSLAVICEPHALFMRLARRVLLPFATVLLHWVVIMYVRILNYRSLRVKTCRFYGPEEFLLWARGVLTNVRPCDARTQNTIFETGQLRKLAPAQSTSFKLIQQLLPSRCGCFYPPQYIGLYDRFSVLYRIHRSSYATTSMTDLTRGAPRDAYSACAWSRAVWDTCRFSDQRSCR